MKAKEYNDIKDALIRVGTSTSIKLTRGEDLVRRGTIMGFMMWLTEYYENNKED